MLLPLQLDSAVAFVSSKVVVIVPRLNNSDIELDLSLVVWSTESEVAVFGGNKRRLSDLEALSSLTVVEEVLWL